MPDRAGDEMIVRLVEVAGECTTVTLTLPGNVVSCRRLDLIEQPLETVVKLSSKGRTVSVGIKSHEIVTLAMKIDVR